MQRFSFKRGLVFIEKNLRWKLDRRLASGKLQFANEAGEINPLEDSKVLSLWRRGDWILDDATIGSQADVIYQVSPRDLSTFPEKWQKCARLRMHYLKEINPERNKYNPKRWTELIKIAAQSIGDLKPPCPATVQGWWRKYRHTKSIITLIPKTVIGFEGAPNPRYVIFEDVINEIYLSTQKRPKSDVVKAVQDRIRQINFGQSTENQITNLGKTTIYRWIDQLHQDIVDATRLGADAARVKYRVAMGGLKVNNILERIEIDHTPLDLIVLEKNTMLPLGRPWLTLAIDKHSRMVVGFYICFNAPSSYSVLQCIKRAILPKDDWLARFPSIKGTWPAYGIPALVATDNGMDLHSSALIKTAQELGIEILYCPAGRPETKGSMERFFRTLNEGLIHKLPGTVFSNIDERGDYPSEDLAAIDMENLVYLITKWIVDVYSVTFHRGIQASPIIKWLESAQKNMIELPVNPQSLEVIIGIPAKRTLFHYGIELEGLHYNSRPLQDLRRCSGENMQVDLKYYEDSVAYIHVFDPYKKEYVQVQAVDENYTDNLHREIHRLTRSHARKVFGEVYAQEQLAEARRDIENIIKEAVKNKKMSVRKNGAHSLMHDSEAVLNSINPITEAMKPVKTAKLNPPERLPDGLNDPLPDLLKRLAKDMNFEDEGDDHEPD
jgi:putative transposase